MHSKEFRQEWVNGVLGSEGKTDFNLEIVYPKYKKIIECCDRSLSLLKMFQDSPELKHCDRFISLLKMLQDSPWLEHFPAERERLEGCANTLQTEVAACFTAEDNLLLKFYEEELLRQKSDDSGDCNEQMPKDIMNALRRGTDRQPPIPRPDPGISLGLCTPGAQEDILLDLFNGVLGSEGKTDFNLEIVYPKYKKIVESCVECISLLKMIQDSPGLKHCDRFISLLKMLRDSPWLEHFPAERERLEGCANTLQTENAACFTAEDNLLLTFYEEELLRQKTENDGDINEQSKNMMNAFHHMVKRRDGGEEQQPRLLCDEVLVPDV